MQLDVKTLYLVNVITAFVMAGVSLLCWHRHREIMSLLGWASGFFLCAAGGLLLGLRTADTPSNYSITSAAIVVAGHGLLWRSVRLFNGARFDLRYGLAPAVLFLVVVLIAQLADAGTEGRSAIAAGTLVLLELLIAWEIARALRDRLRMRLPIVVAVIAIAAMATGMVARAVTVLGAPPSETPVQDPLHAGALFINSIFLVAATFGLLLLINDRQRRRLQWLASIDELTGLLNRRAFFERGGRLLQTGTSGGRAGERADDRPRPLLGYQRALRPFRRRSRIDGLCVLRTLAAAVH